MHLAQSSKLDKPSIKQRMKIRKNNSLNLIYLFLSNRKVEFAYELNKQSNEAGITCVKLKSNSAAIGEITALDLYSCRVNTHYS